MPFPKVRSFSINNASFTAGNTLDVDNPAGTLDGDFMISTQFLDASSDAAQGNITGAGMTNWFRVPPYEAWSTNPRGLYGTIFDLTADNNPANWTTTHNINLTRSLSHITVSLFDYDPAQPYDVAPNDDLVVLYNNQVAGASPPVETQSPNALVLIIIWGNVTNITNIIPPAGFTLIASRTGNRGNGAIAYQEVADPQLVTPDVWDVRGDDPSDDWYAATIAIRSPQDIPEAPRPPELIQQIPEQDCRIGEFFQSDISVYFSDPNFDPLNFTDANLPEGLIMTGQGVIQGTPTGGFQGGTLPADPVLNWDTTPDPPTGQLTEEYSYYLGQHLNNPSNTVLTVASGVLPPGLSIVGLDLVGTPTLETAREITIQATNDTNSVESAQFTVQVGDFGGANIAFIAGPIDSTVPSIGFGDSLHGTGGTILVGETYVTPGNGTFTTALVATDVSDNNFRLGFIGTGLPDDDDSFQTVTIRGQFSIGGQQQIGLIRNDAASYISDDGSGNTQWVWNVGAGWPVGERIVNDNIYEVVFDEFAPPPPPVDNKEFSFTATAVSSNPASTGFGDSSYGFGGIPLSSNLIDTPGSGKVLVTLMVTDNGQDFFRMCFEGTNIPNTDDTFALMTLTGIFNLGGLTIPFSRASGAYTADDGFGNTRWTWGTPFVIGIDFDDSIKMLDGNNYTMEFDPSS